MTYIMLYGLHKRPCSVGLIESERLLLEFNFGGSILKALNGQFESWEYCVDLTFRTFSLFVEKV